MTDSTKRKESKADESRSNRGDSLKSDDPQPTPHRRNARTAGKQRDFDEKGESKNQGHGHPREERSGT